MLLLVRHGTTSQQLLRTPGDLTPATYDEWLLDHPLSERGRREAEHLRERFTRIIAADRYLVSPRARTQETAQIALPHAHLEVDARLHEWHAGESMESLHERARWLIDQAENAVCVAFTHGGFIRAVVAAVLVGGDIPRFGAVFEDLRRTLNIWNASLTIIGHGASGMEILGVNLCPSIEGLAGRDEIRPS